MISVLWEVSKCYQVLEHTVVIGDLLVCVGQSPASPMLSLELVIRIYVYFLEVCGCRPCSAQG